MTQTVRHLLVVDDQEMNRDMLSRRLQRKGYQVSTAESGAEALQMIRATDFDLVLLDIMMPGISGLEVLQTVRQSRSAVELPIIMATARDESQVVVEALNLGANDYVTKPLDFPVVLARVQTQLSLKQAVEENARLVKQLEVRNRFIRDVFGRYLSDEVVTSLLESPEGLKLGGEKRKVTVLVSDLRGFTTLTERLEPEQVVSMLNRYFETMIDIILRYNGTIDDFFGDAIFTIFGAPIQRPDDAARAVACALEMQMAMNQVNARNREQGLPEVGMAIGLNTGDVVVGNLGSSKRTKYGVVGSLVNLASRIESYAVGGQILSSGTTLREAGPGVQTGQQMQFVPKGFEYPVTLYELRGLGEPYHLQLPDADDSLRVLPAELPLQYWLLEGKTVGTTAYEGRLVKLANWGAEILSSGPAPLFSDLKLQVAGPDGAGLGSAYAKVVSRLEDDRIGLRFTSVPPELTAFFRERLQVAAAAP